MADQTWPELGGTEVRYADETWELTGDVSVRGTGEVVEADARAIGDVKHRSAILRFNLRDPPASLNPGNLGDHFDRLIREGDRYHLEVKKEPRTYRYDLESIEYD